MSEFFLELFSEEIPARMQADAAAEVERFITETLKKNELAYTAVKSFVTPRRVGLVVDGSVSYTHLTLPTKPTV